MAEFDFQGLAQRLLSDARNYVPSWLPGGRMHGAEYCVGDLHGKPGDSLRVNLNTGKWADFASNDKGGDLISLYAAIQGVKQIDAAKKLADMIGFITQQPELMRKPKPTLPPVAVVEPKIPPTGTPKPEMFHGKMGAPVASWCYLSSIGRPVFYVARYETNDGKQLLPWSWIDGKWQCKGWPAPRPLYGLDELARRPNDPVMVCYSPDTELLTPKGWKPISECAESDMVAQYDKETTDVSFVIPSDWQKFQFDGQLINIKSDWCDMAVTPDHRILLRKKRRNKIWGFPQATAANDFIYCDQLPNSGISIGAQGPTVSQARLIAAFQADGSFPVGKRTIASFNLKKTRKKERLISLLEHLNIPYQLKVYESIPKWTTIQISISTIRWLTTYMPNKKFNWSMLNWNFSSRKALIEELGFWDGDFVGNAGIRYFTSDAINAQVISAMTAISGYGCILRHDDRPARKQAVRAYVLNLSRKGWRGFSKNPNPKRLLQYKGNVYCCTVPTGFLVTRRNGKNVISGNCEGEKATEAARKIAGATYVVVTWPNGSKAINKANWKPVYGRKVLLWPDADGPGRAAMHEVAKQLEAHCDEIKILNVKDQDGWDAADALEENWNYGHLKGWAKGIVVSHQVTPPPVAQPSYTAQQNVQINIFTEDCEELDGAITAIHERLGIPVSKQGMPVCNVDTISRVLEGIAAFNDFVWFDEFHQRYYTTLDKKVREWSKVDSMNLLLFLQRKLGLRHIGLEMVNHAMMIYAHQRIKNSPKDWFEKLEWDGTARLHSFFKDCFGAEYNDYSQAVGKNFWVGMIARIYQPGCQLDNMVVLEGAQGIGKSKSMRLIGGNWYTEAHESVTSKDFFMALHGKLIVEIAELDSFNRAEVTRIKQVITCPTDRYRAPYDDKTQDHPRRSVFVGTTNEHHWQRDHTGARRFWPIACQRINLGILTQNRKQYFAEAIILYKKGENWYQTPEESTLREQDFRRQSDAWEDIIREYLAGGTKGFPIFECTIQDVATSALSIDIARLEVHVQRRIGNVLRTIGWEKKRVNRGDRIIRLWQPMEAKDEANNTLFPAEEKREPGQEG